MKEQIEEFLRIKGWTQAQLADKIGVPRASITHIMTGRNKSSDTVASKMLLFFPLLSEDWLLYGKGEIYKTPEVSAIPSGKTLGLLFDDEIISQESEKEQEILTPVLPLSSDNSIDSSLKRENMSTTDASIRQPVGTSQPAPEANQIKSVIEVNPPRKVVKIVFFYDDKTFDEYLPQ